MKKKVTLVLSIHIVLGMFGASDAYELLTHGEITNAAYTRSNLGQSSIVLTRLGLNDLPNPLGEHYYDFSTADVRFRLATPFEVSKMNRDIRPNNLRIRGWLMRGAIREDDGGFLAGAAAGEPLDDPYGNFNRFCNHFFDPITRNPLSSSILSDQLSFFGCPNGTNTSNPNWAVGASTGNGDAFSAQPVDSQGR